MYFLDDHDTTTAMEGVNNWDELGTRGCGLVQFSVSDLHATPM